MVVLAVSLTMVLAQTKAVRAAITGAHAFQVYLRLETEIMQKTPVGQYYEALFWKHNDELIRILNTHPEHNPILADAMFLYVPELEALLDGNGDQAYVTIEHVEVLESKLDWFAAVSNSALRDDIQRERERPSLDALVGMTMTEALDFINSKWTPESPNSRMFVPGSDGRWAYYVHNGIYFEYPSQYNVQISGSEEDYVYFIPSTGMPEHWRPFVMKVKVWEVPSNADTDIHTWYSQENILWETAVQTTDFQGFEFMKKRANSLTRDTQAFLYNKQENLAVEIRILAFEAPRQDGVTDYFQLVNQRYEYFQHMVDALRIWKP